jgi:enoyl-CoA hydratase/carnithine racemase
MVSAGGDGHIRLDPEDDRVARVTINQPAKLNALTSSIVAELASVVEQVNKDKGVRTVTLTGNGRAFCVGSDIAELGTYSSPWEFGKRIGYGDIRRRLTKPLVAPVNGYPFGGGLELALSSDIKVAARRPSSAAPEIKLGWIGGSGQCALLARSVGLSNAAQMVLTGEPIDAETALSWGVVTAVLEPEDLVSAPPTSPGRSLFAPRSPLRPRKQACVPPGSFLTRRGGRLGAAISDDLFCDQGRRRRQSSFRLEAPAELHWRVTGRGRLWEQMVSAS